MIAACLEKNPGARTASAADVREGLKTIMKALRIETGIIPGDAAANLPATGAEAEKRTTGLLSMLAERFRESAGEQSGAEFAGRAALCQPGRNGGCAALWLRAGRCHCSAAGAHSIARRAALERADALLRQPWPPGANRSARCGTEVAGEVCARRKLCQLRKRIRSELAVARRGFAERALRRIDSRRFARSDRGAVRNFERSVRHAARHGRGRWNRIFARRAERRSHRAQARGPPGLGS